VQDQKGQLELIRAHQFFRKRSKGVGVELRIGGGEVDQVIRMRKNGMEFCALGMIEERRDFSPSKGRANHCMLFFTKICIAVHLIEQARSMAYAHRHRWTCGRPENFRFSILEFRFRKRHE
jgi:hypothetical protein